jgi:NSS family neurotransmitter:Na+ symporter
LKQKNRGSFSGKIGFVLSAAGASVGLGNIWRFPYLCAKYGGGIFLILYVLLALTFGYTMIVAETAIGRATNKSPVGAYRELSHNKFMGIGGWINAIIPILIVPYYSVIGGWVCKYLYEYIVNDVNTIAGDSFFVNFITNGAESEIWFLVFAFIVLLIIYMGVENGIERVSKLVMPILVILAIIICCYSVTRPGALGGVKFLFIPDFKHFSIMTLVTAMGQMFYSLSIAMGILITFGSYVKKEVSIEESTKQVEIFDTAIAVLASLMIIPAVFAFTGGDESMLKAGPSLMFITMPKIFASMGFGKIIGITFFALVLFAAATSAIALTESAVSTFSDEFGWDRRRGVNIMAAVMFILGSLSSLGNGPLSNVTLFGMQFLDFFDFLTNSVMMPIAALATCILITKFMTVERLEAEVEQENHPFKRKAVFGFMIKFLCPLFVVIILVSAILNVLGIISM